MKILFLGCCLFLVGCVKNPGNHKYVNLKEQKIFPEVVHYGQDVYYFEYVGADFANALAAFLKKSSDLEVAGITIHPSGQGAPYGYFVVFRPKKRC